MSARTGTPATVASSHVPPHLGSVACDQPSDLGKRARNVRPAARCAAYVETLVTHRHLDLIGRAAILVRVSACCRHEVGGPGEWAGAGSRRYPSSPSPSPCWRPAAASATP